ncbi:TonB-dependent receptor [Cellulophaga baltica]|uniref:TonB-dependent receptor n=1 Tax=Cellulophaga TaxID=104264 RepID=UPI001C069B56|nr:MULTISPECIES: TonB-dependent receptor [Cellulophaga]MBU2995669.1 TonB-dependent receptor [Cellulophaga baltica]MDO6767063.1 TonB-dependent receptor [Cellulophaga sp. 1_MG-2023]
MRIYALMVLLLLSIPSLSQSCNNTLSGKVIDLHDGTALEGAMIIVAATEQVITTDSYGRFSIPNLCNQTYAIQISHPYCLTDGYKVKINGATDKTFYLEHHLEELNEVILNGKSQNQKSNTVFENKLSKDKIEQFSNGSLGDALNSLSGVSSLNTGNTVVKPIINGLHSSRVVLINNGVRMEDQEWGVEHAPNLDINTAENITLIKGASAIQYSGDAIAGVIITEPEKIFVKDSLYGKTLVSGSTNGRGSTVTSKLTKSYDNGWFGTVQGTLKRYGDFEAPDYVLSNTGTFERNASLRVGLNRFNYGIEGYYSFYKNEIGILLASHIGGAEDQVRAINSSIPLVINDFTYEIAYPKQDITHNLARLKAFKKFEDFGKVNLQYDFQQNHRLEYDIRVGDDSDTPSLDLVLKTHTLLLDLDSKFSDKTTLKTGIMARYQDNFADPSTGVRRLIPDYEKYDIGIYGITSFQLNDNWLAEAGARFDYTYMDVYKFYRTSFWEERNYDELFPEIVVEEYDNQILTNPQYNFYNVSGTLGTTYTFDNDYKIFFNYSLASRVPNPSELFSEGLHHSASRIELGGLQFTSEIAHKISLTLEKNGDVFGFSAQPFINNINDFIVIEPTEVEQTIRGNFQVWEYRQTNAQLLGIDVDAYYAFTNNFKFKNQFSLVKGYDRSEGGPLISMPPVNTTNEITYENPKVNNLKLALQSEFVFRQNEYPNNNFEVYIAESESYELVDVSTPPDAYHLLNFRSSMDFKVNQKSNLTVGLNVTNILNTSYRNYLNSLRYYADDLGRNFLLNLKFNY